MVVWCSVSLIFFFKQKTAYEMRISDWSSDVCSSDLWTLRYGDEVRDPDDYFDAIKPEKPEAKLLSLALSLIKERTERWDQKMVSDPVQDNLPKIKIGRAS